MKQGRRSFSAALATLPWMLNGDMANAQTSAWPNRPIRLVVPYPPGGASDGESLVPPGSSHAVPVSGLRGG